MEAKPTHAIVLQHAPFEGPARIASLLRSREIGMEVRRLDLGDAVPTTLAMNELLVVMGGPMGVGDLQLPRYAHLNEELALLRQCLNTDAPVLGICLGAQLLAHAAGANVYPMTSDNGERAYEVGWAPVQLHYNVNALLDGLPEQIEALHWHGDTFDLPRENCTLFASTPACRHQAIRLGSRQFGLQFHVEVDVEHVEAFLRADATFVERANGEHGVDTLRADTLRAIGASLAHSDRLLNNILDAMTR